MIEIKTCSISLNLLTSTRIVPGGKNHAEARRNWTKDFKIVITTAKDHSSPTSSSD